MNDIAQKVLVVVRPDFLGRWDVGYGPSVIDFEYPTHWGGPPQWTDFRHPVHNFTYSDQLCMATHHHEERNVCTGSTACSTGITALSGLF